MIVHRFFEGCAEIGLVERHGFLLLKPLDVALAGLDPAIHVFLFRPLPVKPWTPGSSPGEAINK
jgi:hypothetical protein